MVQCYTCGKFGHIQRNCNPRAKEVSGNIQGVNKRSGEDAGISGNPTKKTPRKDAEKDDEGFEMVRKMKWGNKKGEVRVDVIQRLRPNPRITEMSSDDVGTGYDDLTKLPPPLKSDWSDDTPIAGHQNVAGQYEGTHTFLEWCKKRRMDIVFVGEVWVDKKGTGTQSHPSYTLGSKVEKGKRTMVYWRKKLDGVVKV